MEAFVAICVDGNVIWADSSPQVLLETCHAVTRHTFIAASPRPSSPADIADFQRVCKEHREMQELYGKVCALQQRALRVVLGCADNDIEPRSAATMYPVDAEGNRCATT